MYYIDFIVFIFLLNCMVLLIFGIWFGKNKKKFDFFYDVFFLIIGFIY